MSDKIIALVDGSVYSESVCDHAAWAANKLEAPVQLMHVLGRREGSEKQDLSGSIKLGARSALLEELADLDEKRAKLVGEKGRAILEDAQAILEKDGVREITTRLRNGDLIETVGEVEVKASMILIGKRGEAADFAKGHLGSNLERIVRASHKPVLVASRAFSPIQSVLIAYDGGAAAQKALEFVASSPLFDGLKVELVSIGTASLEARLALESASAPLKDAGREVSINVIEGQPESALGAYAESSGADMVVMGAYNHSRLRSLFIGSTSGEMIRSCKVPLVLVR